MTMPKPEKTTLEHLTDDFISLADATDGSLDRVTRELTHEILRQPNPEATRVQISQKILEELDPSDKLAEMLVNIRSVVKQHATEELPEGVLQYNQEELEDWARHLGNKSTPGSSEKFLIFNTLAKNPSPMTAKKALEILKELSEKTCVGMTGSIEDMEIRFPDLKDFEGEIYIHSPKGEMVPIIIVYGVKDSKKEFELTCAPYTNGIFPIEKDGEQINY